MLLACQNQSSNNQLEPSSVPIPDTVVTAPPPKPNTPDSAYLIVPGKSIGHIRLGMSAETVTKRLGKPDSGDAAMGKALSFWIAKQPQEPRHYVAVYTVTDFDGRSEKPKVQQVQVTSPRFRTRNGIGTGMLLSEIRKQFNNLQPLAHYLNKQKQEVYIYDDQEQGIAFEVTVLDSLCTAITIHRKGENMTDVYLPLYPDITWLNQPR
ncbi:hypothetical protein PKOR_04140 [Pontibacter korlensis]|uniref:Uncharacterized protein n=1 Tax=Pontibacter korlensis TaxID=400092 RepID=A0A0E3UW76_9BACT|nr:hypothetical protein PKOR_04140 [Pontibacter korlensis]